MVLGEVGSVPGATDQRLSTVPRQRDSMGSTPPERLRDRIAGDDVLALPGAYDALSARLAERAGFEAVFTSGFSIAATQLGLPDMGMLTMAENVDRAGTIAGTVDVPLVADMDTGYGNVLNVRRTMQKCVDAGIAGVILEDQEWPKKCGHMDEKRVVPTEEHARRIAAAADVREETGWEFVIIGRTDAREPQGLEAAIDRARTRDATWRPAPETILVRRVRWGDVNGTLVGA